MSRYVFRMPDLGEGTVAAEIVACLVKPGDDVREEQIILEVMTEKATVEVPSPVSGRIVSIAGKPGQSVPVGAELVVFDTSAPPESRETGASKSLAQATTEVTAPAAVSSSELAPHARIMASPATRHRAKELGIDLAQVSGSGPGGRIERADFERFAATQAPPSASVSGGAVAHGNAIEEVPIIGVRRLIAQRITEAAHTIPHFSYVEEIDVTQLESLRQHLNAQRPAPAALTYLPFIALALVRVLPQFPQCNARYDAEREVLLQYRALHLGIATQTSSGLKVPVVRDVASRSLDDLAQQIRQVSEAARTNAAKREELSGSTLTLTSLGKLGGIASTPIINAPEVCIIGVNKAVERPVVNRGTIVIRRMMNLSTSCDHRFVDGHDAASMVQALKAYLEQPALIFAP
jgi:2-oxoisovalerate dehydrogenase E2 component (dihydrolipoyl transacylase)